MELEGRHGSAAGPSARTRAVAPNTDTILRLGDIDLEGRADTDVHSPIALRRRSTLQHLPVESRRKRDFTDARIGADGDREVAVRVTVPGSYQQTAQWANEFSDPVVKTVKSTAKGVPTGCNQ